jgi:hypothetical protein
MNGLLEYSSNDGHKSKPTTLVLVLSLTPLSESIMMYPSFMALSCFYTFLMHVPFTPFSISYKVEIVCDLNQDGRYFLLYPDLLFEIFNFEFLLICNQCL